MPNNGTGTAPGGTRKWILTLGGALAIGRYA
jgi:hypothetical protein